MQFMGNALSLVQKIAYIYGYSDFCDENGEPDDQMEHMLTLLVGAMVGVDAAGKAVAELGEMIAKGIVNSSRHGFFKLSLWKITGAAAAGVSKVNFARGVAKIVPVIGGVISGGITLLTLRLWGRKLKHTLRESVG